MKYAIETFQLTKKYRGANAVENLNMKVPEGGIYGFLGPNGAGKSTTMKMILNLVKPDAGSVQVLGKTMNSSNRLEILKSTGSLIESPSCYGHLSGRENLEIAAMLKGVPKKEIDRVLKIVRMEKQQSKKVSQYSLGMKQRLAIALAVMHDPELLILDEPTNHLDMEAITALNNGMIKFPGVILFSSRDHQIVQTTANRIMEIVPGGQLIDKITTYDEYLESDEMARKRTIYSANKEEEEDN